MNTTSPKEDLFADFFNVGGMYTNFGGMVTKSVLQGAVKGKLSVLGRTPFMSGGITAGVNPYFTALRKVKKDFGLSNEQADDFFDDFRLDGLKDISLFPRYVEKKIKVINKQEIEDRNNRIDEQSIRANKSRQETLLEEKQSSIEADKDKRNLTPLYIGLGVVALVGITIYLVRK